MVNVFFLNSFQVSLGLESSHGFDPAFWDSFSGFQFFLLSIFLNIVLYQKDVISLCITTGLDSYNKMFGFQIFQVEKNFKRRILIFKIELEINKSFIKISIFQNQYRIRYTLT